MRKRQKDKLRDTYDLMASDWHEVHQDKVEQEFKEFVSRFSGGARVLDVGCGSGNALQEFVRRGAQPIGIDISKQMLSIAEEQAPEAELHVMDMEDIPEHFSKEVFDAICMRASLLHVPKENASEVARRLATTLQSGGFFYITTKLWEQGREEEEIVSKYENGKEYTRFFSYFTLEEIEKMLYDAECFVEYITTRSHRNSTWIIAMGEKK